MLLGTYTSMTSINIHSCIHWSSAWFYVLSVFDGDLKSNLKPPCLDDIIGAGISSSHVSGQLINVEIAKGLPFY